jgi:[protein-PII] uridylyltransferase
MVFDSFEVVPVDARQMPAAADVEHCLSQALAGSLDSIRPTRRTQPRHLRHFRIAVQIDFGEVVARDSSGGNVVRTMLSLVCNDRPGLLADVAQVLRQQGLRVHDARIATFGERAEDVFQITDQRNQPLDETQQQALCEAMRACLDGEKQ